MFKSWFVDFEPFKKGKIPEGWSVQKLGELLTETILSIGLENIYPLICYRIKELQSHQTGETQQHLNKQNIGYLLILSPCGRCDKRIHITGKSFIRLHI